MLKYAAIGASLAFAAVVQPGPLQAYLLSRVSAIGWRRTLPASFAPLISDGPIAVLALIVLGGLSPVMQSALRMAGGVLLLYLAWRAVRQWQQSERQSPAQRAGAPRTLFEATLVNLLNPNPYLGWALILGPIAVAAWRETPAAGVAVVAAFYLTMVTMLAVLIFSFGGARVLGPGFQRQLLLISALILAGLGIYQLAVSVPVLSQGLR